MNKGCCSVLATVCRVGSVIALLAGVSAESLAQSAAGYELRLLQPGSAAFDKLLNNAPSSLPVPRIAQSARLQGALLINDSAHQIVAFAVRWRVVHKDGSVTESQQAVASEPEGGDVLTGRRPLLTPGEHAFVVPGVQWTKDLGQVSAVAALPSTAAPGEAVAAALDCVLFDDGTFVGPNQSRLFERVLIERKGQFDEAAFIAQLLAEGKSDQAIRLALEGHIQRGRAVATEMKRDFYHAARGRHALRMAVILESDGRETLQAFTSRVALARSRIDEQPASR
jgi:hypothetical protein